MGYSVFSAHNGIHSLQTSKVLHRLLGQHQFGAFEATFKAVSRQSLLDAVSVPMFNRSNDDW